MQLPGRRRRKPADWNPEAGVFWVYAIRSESSGIIYVGQTNDLVWRVRQHTDPDISRSLYTKRVAGPWTLVHPHPGGEVQRPEEARAGFELPLGVRHRLHRRPVDSVPPLARLPRPEHLLDVASAPPQRAWCHSSPPMPFPARAATLRSSASGRGSIGPARARRPRRRDARNYRGRLTACFPAPVALLDPLAQRCAMR